MQIQDNGRRPEAVDARGESVASFRSFAKPSLEVDSDVFAQVFEAIATTPPVQPGSNADNVKPFEKSDAGEVSDLRQVDDEQDEKLGEKSPSTDIAPLPYPIQPVALATGSTTESSFSKNGTESVESSEQSAVAGRTEPGDSVPAFAEKEFTNVETASASASNTASQQVAVAGEDEEIKNIPINGETAGTALSHGEPIDHDQSIDRNDSAEGREQATDPETSVSNLLSEISDENSSRPIDDSANVTPVNNDKQLARASDTSSELRRDTRNQRDRSETSFNESRQDAVNAPQDRESLRSEQQVTSSSQTLPSAAADTGLADASAQASSATVATAIQPTSSAAALTASAGIVAVSGQSSPTTNQGSTATTDLLSISTGTGGRDSLAETSTAGSTGKSRQTDVADRARLVHRIAKAFQKMGADGGHVRLKMHPDELGGVQLEMQVKGRTVTATVTADNEQARQVIQASIADLRQRLESQGLIIERLDVQTRADNGNSDSWSQNSQQSGAGFRDQTSPRDGAWRRQDEIRSGRSGSKTPEFRTERTPLVPISDRTSGSSWVLDRGLDVKL